MSREIKFRAWDGQTMRDVRSIHNVHSQVNVHADLCTVKDDPLSNKAVISSHYTEYNLKLHLMQYTGLKDRNGVEIYEGDIILTSDDLRKQAVGNWKPKMRIIEWTDNKEYKTGFNLGKAQDNKCEVIGNIYENPELLTNNGDKL